MPLFFLVPLCAAAAGYLIWKKAGLQTTAGKVFRLSVSIITWIWIVYQFVSISRYIDDSGEQIQNVIGRYGLPLSWLVLIFFSVYLFVAVLDTFKKQ